MKNVPLSAFKSVENAIDDAFKSAKGDATKIRKVAENLDVGKIITALKKQK